MAFQPVDRLPVIEWAGWWDKTVERWRGEGLPAHLRDAGEIRDYLGLDCYRQLWVRSIGPGLPPPRFGCSHIRDMNSYLEIRKYLYPDDDYDQEYLRGWAEKQRKGEMVVWITLDGYFWFPRVLFGIEPHMYAFYDHAELMHQINRDLAEFHLRVIERLCKVCTPSFMTFAEDMSYNHGPMLSKRCFDEFLAPYYRRVVPELEARRIVPMIDSDGDVTQMIPWLEGAGLEGLLPLERRSGVDVAAIREAHPRFRMIGAFDKTVMKDGEAAMRKEFERLLPVLRQGGFIPGVDHQTPPDVSLATYRVYVSLLKEYCTRAAG